jgi:Tc5 transposase DNA-binding domain
MRGKGPEYKPKESKEPSKSINPVPVFTKKEIATLAQRIEILDWHNANGKNQSKTAKHFDKLYPNLKIKQPLVSAWVKDEAKWRDEWKNGLNVPVAKRARQTQHPEVTEMLELWVQKAMAQNVLLTGEVLRQKWTKFADLAGVPKDERLNLSDGWLTRFKARNGLKQMKQHGEAGSANPETVNKEKERIRMLIGDSGYDLKDVFNMDETGLFYGYVPTHLEVDHSNSEEGCPPIEG